MDDQCDNSTWKISDLRKYLPLTMEYGQLEYTKFLYRDGTLRDKKEVCATYTVPVTELNTSAMSSMMGNLLSGGAAYMTYGAIRSIAGMIFKNPNVATLTSAGTGGSIDVALKTELIKQGIYPTEDQYKALRQAAQDRLGAVGTDVAKLTEVVDGMFKRSDGEASTDLFRSTLQAIQKDNNKRFAAVAAVGALAAALVTYMILFRPPQSEKKWRQYQMAEEDVLDGPTIQRQVDLYEDLCKSDSAADFRGRVIQLAHSIGKMPAHAHFFDSYGDLRTPSDTCRMLRHLPLLSAT